MGQESIVYKRLKRCDQKAGSKAEIRVVMEAKRTESVKKIRVIKSLKRVSKISTKNVHKI